jgi:hypothetical protein
MGLDVVELVSAVEEEFGVELPHAELNFMEMVPRQRGRCTNGGPGGVDRLVSAYWIHARGCGARNACRCGAFVVSYAAKRDGSRKALVREDHAST